MRYPQPKIPNNIHLNPRGSGRTTAMVQGIGPDGGIIIVHSREFIPYVQRIVVEIHGTSALSRISILAITDSWPCMKLNGRVAPIHVDHAFYELADAETIDALHEYMRERGVYL